MDTNQILTLTQAHLMPTYTRIPVNFVRGEGCRLWDSEGKEYLDFVSGIAVNNLGHCHPRVVAAIKEQAEKLIHVSNLYLIEQQAELARLLCENSFADQVFFCNSGAEANEAAIKLARKWSQDKFGQHKHEIIVFEGAFHGRTYGALSATHGEKYHHGFEPLLPGMFRVPYNCIRNVNNCLGPNTCAIMLEPLQGIGGVNVPADDYLPQLRAICDQREILLILDEVQTGLGRTGELFAYMHYGIEPDIMTLAKALAGGLPVGAMLAKKEIAQSFGPGTHAATFGGNPLVMAAGIAAFNVILEEGLAGRAETNGEYLRMRLQELKGKYPFIKEVRGKGLLLGLELDFLGKEVDNLCLQGGLLINSLGDQVLRFLPPLIVDEEEIDEAIAILDAAFMQIAKKISSKESRPS